MSLEMNGRTYRVWMYLLDRPGRWVDAVDISKECDMTIRQVMSAVLRMHDDRVEREGNDLRFNGDERQALLKRREIMRMKHNITDEEIEAVRGSLSTVGSVPISEISQEIGMSKTRVSFVLRMIDGVGTTSIGTTVLYYLEE